MRKLSLLMLLISLFALLDTLDSQPQGPGQVGAMWLVLTWPNGYCSFRRCTSSVLPQEFVTHGLWPQPLPTQPALSYCRPHTDISPLLASHPVLASELGQYWPTLTHRTNLGFWSYQWNKHGRYSRMNQLAYFHFGATRFRGMLSLLAASQVFPGGIYPRGDYVKAIQARTGPVYIQFRCRRDGKDYVLLEIYICLDPLLKSYVSCPLRRSCGPNMKLL